MCTSITLLQHTCINGLCFNDITFGSRVTSVMTSFKANYAIVVFTTYFIYYNRPTIYRKETF